MRSRLLVVGLAVVALVGCNLVSAQKAVRIALESERGSGVSARVFVEAANGQALDGGLVTVTNPGGETQILGFSAQVGAYTGTFQSGVSGKYVFQIRSNGLYEGGAVQEVEHTVVTKSPDIGQISDAQGNDAILGQSLSAGSAISVVWSACEGATVYQLHVMSGSQLVWSVSCADPSVIIPEGSLPSGQLGFRVTAESLKGDPVFQSANFYSASASTGATRYCQLGP